LAECSFLDRLAVPYQLGRWESIPALDGLGTPVSGIAAFTACLSEPGLDERSERFQSSIKLREALTDSMPTLAQAGIAHRLRSSPQLTGSALISTLLADIETLLG
jgi:hypothetical protein